MSWLALALALLSLGCFAQARVGHVARIDYLERRLQRVKDRAEVEANAGAPAGMVAVYVAIEVEHALAGHDGDAMQCMPCHGLPAGRS